MNQSPPNDHSGLGYLLVRVSTALGAIPLSGATVTIRNDQASEQTNGGEILGVYQSDRDGKTTRIPLAAPPRQNSMTQNSTPPYATYHVDVQADGYYSQFFSGVPVYDGVTSIQPAMLVPLSGAPQGQILPRDEQYFDERVNPALRPRTNQ